MKLSMLAFLTGRGAPPATQARHPRPPLDSGQLVELMRCFPIGGKVRLSPEHRQDIVLESIIIAYGINNQLIYTQNDIHIDNEGNSPVFVLDDDWKDRTVREVRRFCFVLPDVGNFESELDYTRRVALANGGEFQRGDSLTLMAVCNENGVPHVNTMVRKRVTLKEGYYANHAVVVLEVWPDTLNHIDQRQQCRVKTQIPVLLQLSEDSVPYPCQLIDFSESSLKIHFGGAESAALARITDRKQVIVTIELPQQQRSFVLLGKVVRKGEDFIVTSLSGLIEGGRFKELELLDALDLKATLLQYPQTRA